MTEHSGVLCLVCIYLALVLELGQLGSTLLVHFLLQVLSLDAVLLVHLLEDVHLMVLASLSLLGGSRLVLSILLSNCRLDLVLLVLLEPLGLLLSRLLQQNILLARLIHILEQVDLGLLLSLPLSLAHLILSLSLLLHASINGSLVGSLVTLRLLVVLLQLNDLLSLLLSFHFLEFLQCPLARQVGSEQLLVSVLLSLLLDCSQLTLGSVVVDEFNVALAVQNELLLDGLLISSLLDGPLLLEHFLLSELALLIGCRDPIALIALPRENVHRVSNLLLFLEGLALFSLELLLGVQHPQLGVHLLLGDGLLELSTLVHELLFALQLRAGHHELGLFSAQVVRLHLELPIARLLHRLLLLHFALLLEIAEALSHLLSNLFRRFQVFHEFRLVLSVLGGK